MESYDVVIVGGGPAGVTCALSGRNTYPDKSIAVIRKLPVALIPCGIPYTVHSLNSVDDDVLPNELLDKANATLIIDEVEKIETKTISLKSGRQIVYDKLVLAVGSDPVRPPIEGATTDGVFLVTKDRESLMVLKERVQSARHVVIVGGGYIGVELADELIKAGKDVTIVEIQPRLLSTSMDEEFSSKAQAILESSGTKIVLGHRVNAILGEGHVAGVKLDDGSLLEADMVVISAGCKPNTQLAQQMGLPCDPDYGVKVNEYLRTADKDVFAIGDCAAKHDFFSGEYTQVMLASTAMAEGRLVGSNLFAIKVLRKFTGVLGSFSTKIGGVAFGISGITEAKAKAMGLDYVVGESMAVDRHPGKLPGASQLRMKLVFARYSHTLLGAQIHGGDSVGELVNMFAVMILNKMSDMEIDNLQIGTHPLLTASPISYPVISATVDAIKKWYQYKPATCRDSDGEIHPGNKRRT